MAKTSKIKDIIRSTPLIHLIRKVRRLLTDTKKIAKEHRALHNENNLFYTLSPALLIGLVKAFKMLDRSCEGRAYYEFGLFKGFCFWFAEQISKEYFKEGQITLYGFDSFEGLPKSEVDHDPVYWAEGNYASSCKFVNDKLLENGANSSNFKLFKGFFSKEHFDQLKKKENFKKVAICVIDSDIYESCVPVLDFIKEYLVPGSILLFDDYNAFNKDDSHGERRALREFEMQNPSFKKEYLFDFGWHGAAFKVISV